MKTWQWIVLVLIFIFVIVPLIYYIVTIRNVPKILNSVSSVDQEVPKDNCPILNTLAPPPDGKRYACVISAGENSAHWELVNN